MKLNYILKYADVLTKTYPTLSKFDINVYSLVILPLLQELEGKDAYYQDNHKCIIVRVYPGSGLRNDVECLLKFSTDRGWTTLVDMLYKVRFKE